MYHFVYLICSILGWVNVIFYSVLLLDIVKRSDDLENVLKSITQNSRSLLLTFFMVVITIYIYSIIAFTEF
jgi:inositol 1,4,5-triphosphate receptor type 1